MENIMNIHGTDGDSVTVGLPAAMDGARRGLINIRTARGAETAPGYRCSNAVELIQTPPHPAHMIKYFTKEGEVYWRNRRTENLEQQTGDLQRLLAAGGQ